MTNKKECFTYDGFAYWLEEYFDYKVVTGSKSHCIKIFNQDLVTYPISKYGTGIRHRGIDVGGNGFKIIIRRFKTTELYLKHLNLPPTYKREGHRID